MRQTPIISPWKDSETDIEYSFIRGLGIRCKTHSGSWEKFETHTPLVKRILELENQIKELKKKMSTDTASNSGYEEGLKDGFIDAMNVSESFHRGEYKRYFTEKFETIRGYYLGIDIYLMSQEKQYKHNWHDITTFESLYETQICAGPSCLCGTSRRRPRLPFQFNLIEWEYSNH